MTTTTITKEDAERAIREAVTADPYRTNMEACIYVRNEAPHCVASVALASLGVPLGALKRLDKGNHDTPVAIDAKEAWEVLAEEGFSADEDAQNFLGHIQKLADYRSPLPGGDLGNNAFTWAEALEALDDGTTVFNIESEEW